MEMMMLVQETVSMVRPQKWMKPPTLTRVRTTQPSTSTEAVRLNSSSQVVANTQTVARKMFRYSSSDITCNATVNGVMHF